jgi:hypothetical protein
LSKMYSNPTPKKTPARDPKATNFCVESCNMLVFAWEVMQIPCFRKTMILCVFRLCEIRAKMPARTSF